MSGPAVRYQVAFRRRAESGLVAPRGALPRGAGKATQPSREAHTAPTAAPAAPTPATRVLALAYAVERQVRTGAIRNYRDAARRLGISHARMSQVMALLLLAPGIQAELIGGDSAWSEVRLRATSQLADWTEQLAGLRAGPAAVVFPSSSGTPPGAVGGLDDCLPAAVRFP